jgi:hypothetical protein
MAGSPRLAIFAHTHIGIVLAEVLDATWMTWLLVVAWRMPLLARVSPRR